MTGSLLIFTIDTWKYQIRSRGLGRCTFESSLDFVYVFLNNPSKKLPQLSYRQLLSNLKWPFFFAIGMALLFGFLGYLDVLNKKEDLETVITSPVLFITVWGIHWGTYLGGAIGFVFSGFRIRVGRITKEQIGG